MNKLIRKGDVGNDLITIEVLKKNVRINVTLDNCGNTWIIDKEDILELLKGEKAE